MAKYHLVVPTLNQGTENENRKIFFKLIDKYTNY